QVAVAELEPGRLAEPAEGTEAGERLASEPPAPLRIGAAGERVEDGVQIGRHVEPEELLVVPGVADDDEPPGISAPREAPQEAGSSDATRQHRDGRARHRPPRSARRAWCAARGCAPWRAPAPRSPP